MNRENNNSSKNPSDESKKSSLAKTACGGLLDDPGNFPSAMYRGERVYFCTTACLQAFTRNPDPFMAGEIEHPIDSI
jgi:YHS domain-containing protein